MQFDRQLVLNIDNNRGPHHHRIPYLDLKSEYDTIFYDEQITMTLISLFYGGEIYVATLLNKANHRCIWSYQVANYKPNASNNSLDEHVVTNHRYSL